MIRFKLDKANTVNETIRKIQEALIKAKSNNPTLDTLVMSRNMETHTAAIIAAYDSTKENLPVEYDDVPFYTVPFPKVK